MHKDMIWGNDEKYSKEFQEYSRRQTEINVKQTEEFLKKYETERVARKKEAMTRAHTYEIGTKSAYIDPLKKQYLEAKITQARWYLAAGLGFTVLIKNFWAIWLILIVTYVQYVDRLRKQFYKVDRKEQGEK